MADVHFALHFIMRFDEEDRKWRLNVIPVWLKSKDYVQLWVEYETIFAIVTFASKEGINIQLNPLGGGGAEALSESPRCNDMVADLHFPWFFGTAIKCEIARRFPRSVVKVGLHVQCKNINISSGVQPWTSTDLKLSYLNT